MIKKITTPGMDIAQFRKALVTHFAPVDRWTGEGTKTLADLYESFTRREAKFSYDESLGTVVRTSRMVAMLVCTGHQGNISKLKEASRVLGGKTWPTRRSFTITSRLEVATEPSHTAIMNRAMRCLDERIIPVKHPFCVVPIDNGDSAIMAALRRQLDPLAEENEVVLVHTDTYNGIVEKSPRSYPGLYTVRTIHSVLCLVPETIKEMIPLQRTAPGKVTNYEWVTIGVSNALEDLQIFSTIGPF